MPPIIGLSWRDDIERTGTLSFTEIDPCHTDFWTGLITSPYRHELEGEIWVLPWTHLQCDEKNLIKSHPKLLSWTGALEAASNAKIAMYWKWHELSEWDLAFALCHMLHRAAAARAEIELAHWRRPDRCPKLADVEKTTGEVYDEFWAVVKQFYADEEDLDCYRVLRRELCLPVDA
ncbi:hypothetical protein OF83DRAFT_1144217 [Amylostereum chailletii]|nr:hypothetical protein OF83DRAFT_1144217 [Amylostereum chailletii]